MRRPGVRQRWADPAPLEISRPRLPWWALLPWWVFVVGAPFVAVGLVVGLLSMVGRRLYRYPVLVVSVVAGLLAYRRWDWPGPVVLAAGLAAAGVVWWLLHRVSFDGVAAVQLRSEWRRLTVYAPRWHRVMVFSGLHKKVERKTYVPRIRRVRSDGWRDRVTVQLLAGQSPAHFEQFSDALAHAFGAASCRIRVAKPRRIVLDFVHADPLRRPIRVPSLPIDATAVDLKRLVLGVTESGKPWRERLLGAQWLVVGSMGAGKASVVWSLLWSLAPLIRLGRVQVFGIDPKGGMELGRCPGVFRQLVTDNGDDAVQLLEHVAQLVRDRAKNLGGSKRRKWLPDSGQPFVLLVIDELADVIAYQSDRKLRERANAAVQTICSQGRAPGVAVVGELQDPRKEIVSFRHLFGTRMALRLDEPAQVDMVLGDGVRERGANAHEIPEATPGVAWVKEDGRREPLRARAFHVTDGDLDALDAFVASPVSPDLAVARALPGRSLAGGEAG